MTKTIKTDQYWLLVDTEDDIYHATYLAAVDGSGVGKRIKYTRTSIEISFTDRDIPGLIAYPKDAKSWASIIAHLPIGNAPLLEGVPVLPTVTKQEVKLSELGFTEPDNTWPSRRWNKDYSDYRDMSGDEESMEIVIPELPKQEEDVVLAALKNLVDDVRRKPNDTRYATALGVAEKAIWQAASQGKKYSEDEFGNFALSLFGAFQRGELKVTEDVHAFRIKYLKSLSPVQEWEFEPETELEGHFYGRFIPKVGDNGEYVHNLRTNPNPEHPDNPIVQGKWKLKNK
jgi:hypothetical protein